MAINPIRPDMAYNLQNPVTEGQTDNSKKTDNTAKPAPKEMTKAELSPIINNLNSFMNEMSADIHFAFHEKTKTLMVQVVDSKTDKVIKEFPPHEFLDTIAKISEYVGALLDKRA